MRMNCCSDRSDRNYELVDINRVEYIMVRQYSQVSNQSGVKEKQRGSK